ncbi:MAG: hemerythrin domain-containing protein [Thermoflavifilum sp.]|nr:hemerythrin domain-containing protein [Thermoflavifilum sp.]
MSTPIKRHQAIQQLSRDHHFALLFCWKIRQGLQLGIEANRIAKYVGYFHTHYLIPHFQEEEKILFVHFSQDEKVQLAIEQHHRIQYLVERIVKQSHVDTQLFNELADSLDAHVRYEERELFTYLEKQLSERQLQQIGDQLKAAQETHLIEDRFDDAFWIKKK